MTFDYLRPYYALVKEGPAAGTIKRIYATGMGGIYVKVDPDGPYLLFVHHGDYQEVDTRLGICSICGEVKGCFEAPGKSPACLACAPV